MVRKAPAPPRQASQPMMAAGTASPAAHQIARARSAPARRPLPAGEVVEDEEQRRTEPTPGIAHAPRKSEERRGGQAEPREIEEPPGAVALSQHPDHAQMQEVDAGYVHVEDIAVGNRAQADEPRDVVHEGGVVNQRPAPRAPAEIERERGASGQNKLQSLARRSG